MQRLPATTKADEEHAGLYRYFPRNGEDGSVGEKSITPDKPQNILEVVDFIEANLLFPLELADLAEKAHLSKFHFCRVFKRYLGLNPMKYVVTLRIEHAKKLLKKGDLSVSVVANTVGFKDMSNFIRQFKKLTGVTPGAYRNTSRIVAASEFSGVAQHARAGN